MFEYMALIDRVIDGDTVVAVVDLGFRLFHVLTLRLVGIDAPELSIPEERSRALEASAYLTKLLLACDNKVLIRTVKDVHDTDKPDSFGRFLATLYDHTGMNLNEAMVAGGYAKPWKPK